MSEPDELTPVPPPPRRRGTLAGGYEAPPPPPPTHIDEATRVNLRLWQLITGAIALSGAVITGWKAYDGIQQNLSGLRADVSTLRGEVSNPGRIKDAVRTVVREELSKPLIVECPKRIIRGEAVTRCAIVMPKE